MNTTTVREYIKSKLTPEEYIIVAEKATEDWNRSIEEYDVSIVIGKEVFVMINPKKTITIRKDIDDYLGQLIKPGNKELLEISRQLKELSEKLNKLALK